jgi:hypothetical protein
MLQYSNNREKGKDKQSYKDRTEKLAERLLPDKQHIYRDVSSIKAACEQLRDGAFKTHPGGYGDIQLQEVDVELFNHHAGWRAWKEGGEVFLTLFTGDNMDENDENRGLLWLSPAALQILQVFDPSTITSFYSPSPQQPRGYRTKKIPLDHLLSSVINQLMKSSTEFFDAHYEYVYRQLKEAQNGSCDRLAILLTLLRSFQEDETVVMVLDRLDLIERGDLDPWDLIDQLVATMSDPAIVCTVKLVILGLQDSFCEIKHIEDVARKRNWAKMKGKKVLVHGKLVWGQENVDEYEW